MPLFVLLFLDNFLGFSCDLRFLFLTKEEEDDDLLLLFLTKEDDLSFFGCGL